MGKTVILKTRCPHKIGIAVYQPKKKKFQIHELKNKNLIGRMISGTEVDIQIDSSIVSRKHGVIMCQGGECWYKDLNSTNGTYINGMLLGRESIQGKLEKKLEVGDVLRIDHENFKEPHPNAVILVVIEMKNEEMVSQCMTLAGLNQLSIGRRLNDWNLDDKAMSEKHAELARENGEWTITDCGSTNGTFVNNVRIDAARLCPLDVIRIAGYTFIYLKEELFCFYHKSSKGQLIIKIEERSVRKALIKKQILLQNINLSVYPGEMVMIIGGSGAGKTTFINAVLGYERAKGTIEHDGIDIYKNYGKIKGDIGFVPQQDLLRQEDTVYSTLYSVAEMRMNANASRQEREERVDHVLNSLGLSRERNSVIRKLSGGQRKRLSIAVELISDPSLFFLDEPDSGLDGVMAKALMGQLREVADEGKIVMIITHAPDRVRELFDKVIVLAKGEKDNIGHMAFYGTVEDALAFFDAVSMEDVVRKLNRIDEGGEGLSDFYIEKYRRMHKAEVHDEG